MKILIHTVGTLGDLLPFLELACQLKSLHHEVHFVTNSSNAEKAKQFGFTVTTCPPHFHLDDPQEASKIMCPTRGTQYLYQTKFLPEIKTITMTLLNEAKNNDLLISGSLAFASSVVHEITGIPWISIGLQPAFFIRPDNLPVFAHAPWLHQFTSRWPWFSKIVYQFLRKESDSWANEWRTLRRSLGLSLDKHFLFDSQHSPQLQIGAFDHRLISKSTKPYNGIKLVGFPKPKLDDPISEDIKHFLEIHSNVFIFTLGSAAFKVGDSFFKTCFEYLDAHPYQSALIIAGNRCNELQKRFAPLPNVKVCDYCPYDRVFSKATLIIHQGGIGTLAAALRAGIPSVVIPFCHDQFDNAYRSKIIGVNEWVPLGNLNKFSLQEAIDLALKNKFKARLIGDSMALENKQNPLLKAILDFMKIHFESGTFSTPLDIHTSPSQRAVKPISPSSEVAIKKKRCD